MSRERRTCPACGEDFETYPSRRKRCCSQTCAMRLRMRGRGNPRYNGGLCFHRGRWLIWCRDRSTVNFARAVMEAHLGRHLRSGEIVHHISGDSTDDRIENLELTTRAAHIDAHRDDLHAARGIGRNELVI